jgi:hypothetical protein
MARIIRGFSKRRVRRRRWSGFGGSIRVILGVLGKGAWRMIEK